MEITVNINRIVVFQGIGSDTIFLYTSLPQGLWPFGNTGETMRLNVAAKTGPSYIETNFGITKDKIEIIQTP